MTVRRLTAAALSGYLHAALALGFKEHVFRVSIAWCDLKVSFAKQDASWAIQDALIEKHNFYRCPSCLWATKERDEHINERGSYCATEENSSLGLEVYQRC
jgi:hypothetical protein